MPKKSEARAQHGACLEHHVGALERAQPAAVVLQEALHERRIPRHDLGEQLGIVADLGLDVRDEARAHLVVSRSGASTVADLAAIGRPAILVPLPGSLDADQKNNAQIVASAGGGWMVEQATVSPLSLGSRLTSLLGDPAALTRAAAAAATLGRPNAVEGLAALAERLAGKAN